MTLGEINVLVGRSDWAWDAVIEDILAPRGINAMVCAEPGEAIAVMDRNRIHTAILDMDSQSLGGLGMIRIIQRSRPSVPCITVSSRSERSVLSQALELEVFSVVAKPVDMQILQEQLNRLFVRRYNSSVFSGETRNFK